MSIAIATLLSLAPAPVHGQVAWFEGTYAEALEAAAAKNKPIFIEFWEEGCGWCTKLAAETLSEQAVATELANFVCLSIDARGAAGQELASSFNLKAFPALFFLSSAAKQEDVLFGFQPPLEFVREVQRIGKGEGTFSDLERRIARDPNDLEAHYDLAHQKYDFGDAEGYYHHLHVIQDADPSMHSLPMRRMVLGGLQEELFGCRYENGDIDFRPFMKFMSQEQHPELLFDGWSHLARVHTQVKEGGKAREAFASAWNHVPDTEVSRFGHELAWTYWKHRKELKQGDKHFALEVARTAHTRFETIGGTKAEEAAYLDVLACSYYLNGDRDQALTLSRRCVELDPNRRDYRANLSTFKLAR
jgi:thiol-disulfide isomerase/thioredoxin